MLTPFDLVVPKGIESKIAVSLPFGAALYMGASAFAETSAILLAPTLSSDFVDNL
jgi:hypothetical protein